MAEDHAPELINQRQVISMDTLPDEVLLQIFHSNAYGGPSAKGREKTWQSLVHVCRRWRAVVFGFPRHLNLQLLCTKRTRARDLLDIWPALPLIILYEGDFLTGGVDNIIVGLERTNRVRVIFIRDVNGPDLEMLLGAMQQPLSELTYLGLDSFDKRVPVIPDSFLGGSASHLQSIEFCGIPFPGLPKLLLSATRLVTLRLDDIPHSGYISPGTLVTALSTLTSLKYLSLKFESPRSCPDPASRRPLPSTRFVVPVLRSFSFKGVSEYLEDLVACIDTPQLKALNITFFNDVVFDTPQFIEFIRRTPMSRTLEEARIILCHCSAIVEFSSQIPGYRDLDLEILFRGLDWQVSSLGQIFTSCSPPLSRLEVLSIHGHPDLKLDWRDNVENGLWLELLRPFIAVKNLYISTEFTAHIASALRESVEGRTTEVLPALQNILLGGLQRSSDPNIGQFIAARKVAGHTIAVSPWLV